MPGPAPAYVGYLFDSLVLAMMMSLGIFVGAGDDHPSLGESMNVPLALALSQKGRANGYRPDFSASASADWASASTRGAMAPKRGSLVWPRFHRM